MYLVKFESNIDYGMIIFSKGTNSKVHKSSNTARHKVSPADKYSRFPNPHKPRQGDDKSQPYDGQPD